MPDGPMELLRKAIKIALILISRQRQILSFVLAYSLVAPVCDSTGWSLRAAPKPFFSAEALPPRSIGAWQPPFDRWSARLREEAHRLIEPFILFPAAQTPEGLVIAMADMNPGSVQPPQRPATHRIPQLTVHFSKDFYDLMKQMEKVNPSRARQIWRGLYSWLHGLPSLEGHVWSSGKPLLGKLSNFMELRRFRDLRIIFKIQRSPAGIEVTFIYLVTKNQFGQSVQRWLDDAVLAADGRRLVASADGEKIAFLEDYLYAAAPTVTLPARLETRARGLLSHVRNLRQAAELLRSHPSEHVTLEQARPWIIGALHTPNPDFEAIGILFRHLETAAERDLAREEIELWTARQPSGEEALLSIESAYLELQVQSVSEGLGDARLFHSPLIEDDIQARGRAENFSAAASIAQTPGIDVAVESAAANAEAEIESLSSAVTAPVKARSAARTALYELYEEPYRPPVLSEDLEQEVRAITGISHLTREKILAIHDVLFVQELSHTVQQQRLQTILELRDATSKTLAGLRSELEAGMAGFLEQPWNAALQRYAEDITTLRWAEEDEDSAYLANLRKALQIAILGAPEGKPVVVRGAALLCRALVDVLHAKRFSKVILIDVSEALIVRSLERAGIGSEEIEGMRRSGRLLLEEEPPLLLPEDLAHVMETLDQMHNPDKSLPALTHLYENLITRITDQERSKPVKKKAGLFIQIEHGAFSVDAVPVLIERMLEKKIANPWLPYRSGQRFVDDQRTKEYQRARLRLHGAIAYQRAKTWAGSVVTGGKFLISGEFAHFPFTGDFPELIKTLEQHGTSPTSNFRGYWDSDLFDDPIEREFYFAHWQQIRVRPRQTTVQRITYDLIGYRSGGAEADMLTTQIWAQEGPAWQMRFREMLQRISPLRVPFLIKSRLLATRA